jgi:hypothetical protein
MRFSGRLELVEVGRRLPGDLNDEALPLSNESEVALRASWAKHQRGDLGEWSSHDGFAVHILQNVSFYNHVRFAGWSCSGSKSVKVFQYA